MLFVASWIFCYPKVLAVAFPSAGIRYHTFPDNRQLEAGAILRFGFFRYVDQKVSKTLIVCDADAKLAPTLTPEASYSGFEVP